MAEDIEARWRTRLGATETAEMRAALLAVVVQFELDLPPYLPVVTDRLFTQIAELHGRVRAVTPDSAVDLSVLLAQTLIAFTLEFERESAVSLPIAANVLRVLYEDGVRMRDLPLRTGVSKQAVSMSVGVLTRGGFAVAESDPAIARTKVVRLTRKGQTAQDADRRSLVEIEQRWQARFGRDVITEVRRALNGVVDLRDDGKRLLAEGLRPYPEGWRTVAPYATQTEAVLADPMVALPHQPIVLHRGGWPDGS